MTTEVQGEVFDRFSKAVKTGDSTGLHRLVFDKVAVKKLLDGEPFVRAKTPAQCQKAMLEYLTLGDQSMFQPMAPKAFSDRLLEDYRERHSPPEEVAPQTVESAPAE